MRNRGTFPKGPKGKADRLWGQIIRARGACQSCGATTGLQAAHIVRRGYSATRHDLDNGLCLCVRCHLRVDTDAWEFVLLIDKTIGQDEWQRLRELAHKGVGKKYDYEARVSALQTLLG